MLKIEPVYKITLMLQATGLPVCGVSVGTDFIEGQYPPNLRIDFLDDATDEQKDQAYSMAKDFNWQVHIIDFDSFKGAINIDPSISLIAKIELFKFFPILGEYLMEDVVVKQTWAGVKAVYANSWLDQSTADSIEKYATIYNIPLK